MKTLLRNALVMCTIVASTGSMLEAACRNGVCSRKPAAKVVAVKRTVKAPVKSTTRQPARSAKPAVRRGGCRNGQCSL
jgi:hypothetical protein